MVQRRILIVDDEALFRTSAADSLRARFPNVEVLEAEDGEAAIAVLEKVAVDVLVSDLQMPRVGGLELVTYISKHRMPVQVIVVSAHVNETTRKSLDELGALACIDKPIELSALHRNVERMLAVPRAHVQGVALSGFLQLLEMERQTCGVRVTSVDGDGTLVFEQGQLMDAWTGDLVGDAAAIELLRYHGCTLDVVTVLKPTTPRTTLPLSFLMLEAARRADEDERLAQVARDKLLEDDFDIPESLELHRASVRPPPMAEEGHDSSLVRAAMALGGALAAVLVDSEKLKVVSHQSRVENLDVCEAALANAELYNKELELLARLGIKQSVEELLIAQSNQFHILRPFAAAQDNALLFLLVDRASTNLALTRNQLGGLDQFYAVQRAQMTPGSN